MIEEVSRQMFRQFSTCVRQRLEIVEETQPAEPNTADKTDNASVASDNKAVAAAPLAFRALWAIIARFSNGCLAKVKRQNHRLHATPTNS